MDELLAELGITPIGQDTDNQHSEPLSVFYDDPLTSLDDSSGSLLELQNAPPAPIDLNVLVNNIWSSEMVNKNHLSGRDSPKQSPGVINTITTYESMSPTSMADFANANISIENYSSNCPCVTSSENDCASLDGMDYESIIQPKHAKTENADQVTQAFLSFTLDYTKEFIFLSLAEMYISSIIVSGNGVFK